MLGWRSLTLFALTAVASLFVATRPSFSQMKFSDAKMPEQAEFYFLRAQYVDQGGGGFGGFGGGRGGGGRRGGGRGGGGFGRCGGEPSGWWCQDWPEADAHFAQGIKRLTRIDVGEPRNNPLDENVFNYPWIYITQAGYMDLSQQEVTNLHDYLLRGGFLVTDDFWGLDEWEVFRDSMDKVLPGVDHIEIDNSHPMMNVMYNITERVTIPGMRHLFRGPGGTTVIRPGAIPPHWRAMHDPKGRMVVASNFNQDVGDAWEHADWPEYPENMTSLAYRFGINYIIYAMTH